MAITVSKVSVSVAALALAALSLTACSGDSNNVATPQASDSATQSQSTDGPTDDGSGPCVYTADGSDTPAGLPPSHPALQSAVDVTITTNHGDLKVTMDATRTPCTVNSFAFLADAGFFDNTICHRLTTSGIYVLQCGDPEGTGFGGPGYGYANETDGSETYTAGTLAMAHSSLPDSNGSQFFIVYADSPLPPDYTVFGHLDAKSLKIVRAIARAGENTGTGDGAPLEAVDINKVTVHYSLPEDER